MSSGLFWWWVQGWWPSGIPISRYARDVPSCVTRKVMTRVMTFLVTHEGTSRAYREIGIPDGHHPCTHHQNKPELIEKVTQINCYHMKQFAGWMEKLKSIEEGDGKLLDNLMIVYGAGLSDGNRHLHEDLPTLIAGHGGSKAMGGQVIRGGQRIVYRRETPMCNLFLTL